VEKRLNDITKKKKDGIKYMKTKGTKYQEKK